MNILIIKSSCCRPDLNLNHAKSSNLSNKSTNEFQSSSASGGDSGLRFEFSKDQYNKNKECDNNKLSQVAEKTDDKSSILSPMKSEKYREIIQSDSFSEKSLLFTYNSSGLSDNVLIKFYKVYF